MDTPSTLPPDFVSVILNIHQTIVKAVDEDVPDPGLFKETPSKIEAALARVDEGVYGRDSFPTIEEKAAILIKELNDLHCFPDGNKRTSLVAMAYYLFWNRQPFVNTTNEAEMVRRIADHSNPANMPTFAEIVDWIRENSRRVDIGAIAASPRFKRYPTINFKLSVEADKAETRQVVAIRADAVHPTTGKRLSTVPFLRRVFWFAQKPVSTNDAEAASEPAVARARRPNNAAANQQRRRRANKRKRRRRRS